MPFKRKVAAAARSTAPIGKIVDNAMVAIERGDRRIKGVLSKHYARLGQLFFSMQIPVGFWFVGKSEPSIKCHAASELKLALAA